MKYQSTSAKKKISKIRRANRVLAKETRVFQAGISGEGKRFAIVISRFNEEITQALLQGALGALGMHGVTPGQIEVFWCPGAFELPLVCQQVIRHRKRPDAVIALGAVIRGETPHFEYVSKAATDGILKVSLESGVPIAFGVLTTDTPAQAIARAQKTGENKGKDAALTALEMVSLSALLLD